MAAKGTMIATTWGKFVMGIEGFKDEIMGIADSEMKFVEEIPEGLEPGCGRYWIA